jgi:hypothetical protein
LYVLFYSCSSFAHLADYDEQVWDQIVLALAPFEVAMDEACFATLLDYVEVG